MRLASLMTVLLTVLLVLFDGLLSVTPAAIVAMLLIVPVAVGLKLTVMLFNDKGVILLLLAGA